MAPALRADLGELTREHRIVPTFLIEADDSRQSAASQRPKSCHRSIWYRNELARPAGVEDSLGERRKEEEERESQKAKGREEGRERGNARLGQRPIKGTTDTAVSPLCRVLCLLRCRGLPSGP